MKTLGYLAFCVGLVFLLQGCSNTWKGVKQTGHGIVEDTKNLGNPNGALRQTDDWIRENMW